MLAEKELDERQRMVLENQLIEALRLCKGEIEEKQLKDICYALNIDGAVASGWLTEKKNQDGTRCFVRGPNLRPRELRRK